MKKYSEAKKKALKVINTYPKTKVWNPYLTLKCWRKCFFDIFVKKYWLNWKKCKYSDSDVYRRVKIVECFDYLLKNYEILSETDSIVIVETIFFRFIIKKYYFRKWSMRLEILSFYDK